MGTITSRFLSLFAQLIEPFRFFKHRRERKAHERALEREHQLAMLQSVTGMIEALVDGQAKQASETAAALVEIAKSNQAQAEGFTTWLKSFQVTEPPTTSVVREEDEFNEEQKRFLETIGVAPGDVPEEFRLAFDLQRGISDLAKTSPI